MTSKQLYNRGLKLIRKGDYTAALRDLDRSIALDPRDADAYSDRGVTKFHLKNLDGALADMNESLRLDPENPYRYASRAYIRDSKGDLKGAIEDYRKALEMDPENAINQNNLGLLEEKLGYMKNAQKRFNIADAIADTETDSLTQNAWEARNKKVKQLLDELNIDVRTEKKLTLFGHMMSIFKSKESFREYLGFIRKIFSPK